MTYLGGAALVLVALAACAAPPRDPTICMSYDGIHAADIRAGVALWESTGEVSVRWDCTDADTNITVGSYAADWRGQTRVQFGHITRVEFNTRAISETSTEWSSVSAHEFGHTMGLDHGGGVDAIMHGPSGGCLDADDLRQMCEVRVCSREHSADMPSCLGASR